MKKKTTTKKAPAKTPSVSRSTVKSRVLRVIEAEALRNSANAGSISRLRAGDETLRLLNDLNIDSTRRTFLSVDYTEISLSVGGITVGPRSARDAVTVKKAIDLVHKRANRTV